MPLSKFIVADVSQRMCFTRDTHLHKLQLTLLKFRGSNTYSKFSHSNLSSAWQFNGLFVLYYTYLHFFVICIFENMSLHALPFIFVNLGCEMLYVVQQRLHAQNIREIKGKVVLREVIKIMFGSDTFNQIMQPQEPYDITTMRTIFSKIAHSSIMKLSV